MLRIGFSICFCTKDIVICRQALLPGQNPQCQNRPSKLPSKGQRQNMETSLLTLTMVRLSHTHWCFKRDHKKVKIYLCSLPLYVNKTTNQERTSFCTQSTRLNAVMLHCNRGKNSQDGVLRMCSGHTLM